MSEDRTKLSDAGEPHERQDPEAAELEIDAANDALGGPTTGSLDAGLTSQLHVADEDEDQSADGSARI